jgi:DNA-binding transcriptional regulator LsrR (DeoR family)
MNFFKIVKTKRGRSYIMNKNTINKIEQERYKSLQTQRQFADKLKISRRNYQRMIAGKTIGINTVKMLINKILNKNKIIHTSNYDSYDDLEKELSYLDGLSAKVITKYDS